MPEAVAAVAVARPVPGRSASLNDPYTGGTHLPDITLVSRTELGLRGLARPPRRRRRHGAGEPAGRLARALPGGPRDPARSRSTDDVLTLLLANMRNPDERRGDLRAQLAAHRLAERRIDELCERRGREPSCGGDGRAVRLLRAAGARGDRAAPRRPLRGRRRRRGDRRRARDLRVTVDGRRATRSASTSTGTAPQHDGNLNCPLVGDALGLLLRRPLPHRAGPARVRRRLRAGDRDGARRLPRQRAAARGRRRRQHRDVVPDRRRRLRARSAGDRRAGPGSGDDEQRRARQRALHLLRDDRRRAGRVPRTRTGRLACTWRCRTR